ncbi:MAG: hypothetical protein JWO69_24, partial [Thermoleophilia bacterium]|nr:hypothetical protein [Thermoleophilia bacterium]
SAARVTSIATLVAWAFVLAWLLGVSHAEAASSSTDVSPSAKSPVLEERRSTPQTTFATVGATVMCPSCDTTLDQSNAPAAERMKLWVRAAIAAGWTEEEIRDGLVREYGGDESILAVPRAQGLGLAIWIVPGLVILAAAAGGAVLLRRWRRSSPAIHADSSSISHGSSSDHSA